MDLERQRAFGAAGRGDTSSDPRFQDGLPFEPVNQLRLSMLRAERLASHAEFQAGEGRFAHKRRQAQIAARHVLQQFAAGLKAREASAAERERAVADAIHAAELQLPASWLPFVVAG